MQLDFKTDITDKKGKLFFIMAICSFGLFLIFKYYLFQRIWGENLAESIPYLPFKFYFEFALLTLFLGSSILFAFQIKTHKYRWAGFGFTIFAAILWFLQIFGVIYFGFSYTKFANYYNPSVLKRIPSPNGRVEAVIIVIPGKSAITSPYYQIEIEYPHSKRGSMTLLKLPGSDLGFENDVKWENNNTLNILDKNYSIFVKPKIFP